MAHSHGHTVLDPKTVLDEPRFLEARGRKFMIASAAVGILALIAAFALGAAAGDGFKRFSFSYLLNFAYFLSLSLGALFFVGIQYLTKASWSVVVRRIAETFAALFPLLAILALPIILPVLIGGSPLYSWTTADSAKDHLLHAKAPYLNPAFYIVRMVIYFGAWTALGLIFHRRSVAQDASADVEITRRQEKLSAPAMVVFALTLTFAAIDFIMALDYTWYSTIFGVYFFSGSVLGFFAFLTAIAMLVQRLGWIPRAITIEHYHDLGKLMFAFTMFWAYIAFSQYMLIWYANLPEETGWFLRRQSGEWTWFSWFLLVGHFIVPFLYLISRGIKRRKRLLIPAALWLIAMHWIDLYYLIVPEFGSAKIPFTPGDVLLLAGIGGIWLAGAAFVAGKHSLIPVGDPRLGESLRFENV